MLQIFGLKRFGHKCRICIRRCESEMKLGSIASKRVYGIERYTQRFFRNRRHWALFRKGRAVFVISGKFIESPGPAIALGFNRSLEDRERFRPINRWLIFDGPGTQRN